MRHARCADKDGATYWFCDDCQCEIEVGAPVDLSEDFHFQAYLNEDPSSRHLRMPEWLKLEEEEGTGLAAELLDNYRGDKGALKVKSPDGWKLFPPPAERQRIAERFHDDLLHPGTTRTVAAVA